MTGMPFNRAWSLKALIQGNKMTLPTRAQINIANNSQRMNLY